MNLNKNDFYYGALLSQLINSGFAPAIMEREVEHARVYSVSNDHGDYKIYTKYISKPDTDREEEKRWDFLFSTTEIDYLKSRGAEQIIIALICGVENLRGSKIAFLSFSDYENCIGRNYRTPDRNVKVKHQKGSKYFTLYGTGLDGKDNYIRITGNITRRLKELERLKNKNALEVVK